MPQSVHTAAELAADINLLPDQISLFRREEARVRLASHGMREAEVRTVTSLGVLSTSATWFAALDGAFRQGATAHGFGIGELGGELADLGRDNSRSGDGHKSILRLI